MKQLSLGVKLNLGTVILSLALSKRIHRLSLAPSKRIHRLRDSEINFYCSHNFFIILGVKAEIFLEYKQVIHDYYYSQDRCTHQIFGGMTLEVLFCI